MNSRKLTYYFIPTVLKVLLSKQFSFLYSVFNLKPTFAALNITDKCCFKCIMCNQWKSKNDEELSTENWFGALSQLKDIGIKEVVFSGGEPFLRNDIIDIITYANKISLGASIISNGYLLNKEIIGKVMDAGVKSFSISIDATGEHFDDIRGVKGAYQKVIDSCNLLCEHRRNGQQIYLYFTLMKTTLNYYREVFALAEKFHFPFVINLFDYTPYFFQDLREKKNDFWLDKNDISLMKDLQRFIIEKKESNPASVYLIYSEIKYLTEYFKDPLQKQIPCVVSQQRIGVDSRGNVYGGCWSMGSFGNLKKNSLEDIIGSTKYKSAHKNMFFKRCPGCSCGYSKNLRYYLPYLFKEMLFRILPFKTRLMCK